MLLLALKVWVPQHDTSPLTPSVCIIFKLIWKRVLPDIASEALSVFVSVFIYLGLRLKTLEGATCFWVYWHIADQGSTIRLVRLFGQVNFVVHLSNGASLQFFVKNNNQYICIFNVKKQIKTVKL